jgi:hypothetical protein
MALAVAGVSAGEADARRRQVAPEQPYVVAESRFGHGTVSGAVRPGRNGGFEVQTPGGNWLICGRSCSETLRTETVDFWENRGAGENNRIDNAAGIFGDLTIRRRY